MSALLVNIIFALIFFGTIVLFKYISYLSNRHKQETVLKMLELGQEMSPEMLTMMGRKERLPRDDIRSGLVWIAIGIPLTIVIAFEDGLSTAVTGLVPVFIGLAYLYVAKKEHKD